MDYRSIQTEKEKAMMRYLRLRNIGKMWRLLEIFLALAVLSWSSTRLPFVLKIAGRFLIQLYEYLFSPLINFVIGNAIIIIVVVLSRQNTSGNNTASTGDVFDQYLKNTESVSGGLLQTPPPLPVVETDETEMKKETVYKDKQIVVTENAVKEIQCDAVSEAIEEGKKQIQRFKRTHSEKLKRDLGSEPGRILRRSETVSISAEDRAITSFDTVDSLSNEDFNRTIEDVIAKHRRFLWAQKVDENDQ